MVAATASAALPVVTNSVARHPSPLPLTSRLLPQSHAPAPTATAAHAAPQGEPFAFCSGEPTNGQLMAVPQMMLTDQQRKMEDIEQTLHGQHMNPQEEAVITHMRSIDNHIGRKFAGAGGGTSTADGRPSSTIR